MKTFILIMLISFIFFCVKLPFSFAGEEEIGRRPSWSIEEEETIRNVSVSDDGTKLFYLVDNDDYHGVIKFIDNNTGKKLWEKTLTEFKRKNYDFCRFIDNQTIIAGENNQIIFLNANDGKVIKSIPLICESWYDVSNDPSSQLNRRKNSKQTNSLVYETPVKYNNSIILFSSDGFQIINLIEKKEIYRSSCSAGILSIRNLGKVDIITPSGGGMFSSVPDSVFVYDKIQQKINFKESFSNLNLNYRFFNPIIYYEDRILIYGNDNISLINANSGEYINNIIYNPNEPDFIAPIEWKNKLFLIVSKENVQEILNPENGKSVLSTKKGDVPGITENLIIVDDGIIFFTYDNENNEMILSKVNQDNGTLIWKKVLFEFENQYLPGHQSESFSSIIIESVLTIITAMTMNRLFTSHSPQYSYYPNYKASDFKWLFESDLSSSSGYAKMLSLSDNIMELLLVGDIDAKINNSQNEQIISIDISKGEILKYEIIDIYKDSDVENILNDYSVWFYQDLSLIQGNNRGYILNSKNLIDLNKKELNLQFLDINNNTLIYREEIIDEDIVSYWRYDLSKPVDDRELLIQITSEKPEINDDYYSIIRNTDFFGIDETILITEEEISAYSILKTPDFDNPKWSYSFESEEFEIGEFDVEGEADDYCDEYKENPAYSYENSLQGVIINKDGMILMGSDALGFIKKDGSCKWFKEWRPDASETLFGVSELGNSISFSTGGDTRFFKKDCSGEILVQKEDDLGDFIINFLPDHKGIIYSNDEIIEKFIF